MLPFQIIKDRLFHMGKSVFSKIERQIEILDSCPPEGKRSATFPARKMSLTALPHNTKTAIMEPVDRSLATKTIKTDDLVDQLHGDCIAYRNTVSGIQKKAVLSHF